jgi:hypothetical protein
MVDFLELVIGVLLLAFAAWYFWDTHRDMYLGFGFRWKLRPDFRQRQQRRAERQRLRDLSRSLHAQKIKDHNKKADEDRSRH